MAEVTLSGPFFDERAGGIMHDLQHEAVTTVGQQALADVHLNLDTSIRHPTPYYETQIRMENLGDSTKVNDRDIVYGPWLEGVGSRNRTTRFKGYFSFRRATQSVQEQVPKLMRSVVERAVRRLNG